MKRALRSLLFALCATGAVTLASAQQPPPRILATVMEVKEASSSNVTLPASIPGSLLMPECGVRCPPKSYPVTAETIFVLHGTQVTLAQFKAAILGKDRLLGVGVRVKTGDVVSVRAP